MLIRAANRCHDCASISVLDLPCPFMDVPVIALPEHPPDLAKLSDTPMPNGAIGVRFGLIPQFGSSTRETPRARPVGPRFTPLKVSCYYITFGTLWVLYAGRLFSSLGMEGSHVLVETIKGLILILTTGIGLYLLTRRDFIALSDAAKEIRDSYEVSILALTKALEVRDRDTAGHSNRVAAMTVRIARMFGIDESQIEHIRRGALLHDIGKIGVPDAILHKPGPLTDAEMATMKQHPVIGFQLLAQIPYLQPAIDIPFCHHERWDGSGYPRGLQGEQIPIAARIFAVADTWDAMTTDRPYRGALPPEDVLEHIKSLSGIHFDPGVVVAFCSLIGDSPCQTFSSK